MTEDAAATQDALLGQELAESIHRQSEAIDAVGRELTAHQGLITTAVEVCDRCAHLLRLRTWRED